MHLRDHVLARWRAAPAHECSRRGRPMPVTIRRDRGRRLRRARCASPPGERRCRRSNSPRPRKPATNAVRGTQVDILGRSHLLERPRFITAIWSDMESASSWSWVTSRKVMPTRRCRAFSSSASACAAWGRARPAARRAAARRAPAPATARARPAAARRPKAARGWRDSLPVSPTRSNTSCTRCVDIRHAVAARTELDVLARGEVGEQRVTLKHRADVALVGLAVIDDSPLSRHVAGVRLLEPGDHAQGGGLAAARRSEQARRRRPAAP